MGRAPRTFGSEQPITFLWERHKEIARRLVLGQRQVDIAQDLGMSETRLSQIINSPLFQARLKELSERADEESAGVAARLDGLRARATEVLEEVLTSKTTPFNAQLQVKVAESILDRRGFSKEQRITNDSSLKATEILSAVLEGLKSKQTTGSAPAGPADMTATSSIDGSD